MESTSKKHSWVKRSDRLLVCENCSLAAEWSETTEKSIRKTLSSSSKKTYDIADYLSDKRPCELL